MLDLRKRHVLDDNTEGLDVVHCFHGGGGRSSRGRHGVSVWRRTGSAQVGKDVGRGAMVFVLDSGRSLYWTAQDGWLVGEYWLLGNAGCTWRGRWEDLTGVGS